MTIENPEEYAKSKWDWAVFNGCFGDSKISLSDIDGLAERNGLFLIIETKGEGVPPKQGQEIMFEAFRRTELFTIFLVWGKPGVPVRSQFLTRHRVYPILTTNMDKLRASVARWYEYANSQ